MFNFDSLTLKYFFDENKDFINGAIVQKIQLPSRYEVILNIRNLNKNRGENKKLYININPKYPHICFVDENSSKKRDIKIPTQPPMFCMQLRKYLNGSKIKDFKLVEYERILEFYFDCFDEIGSLTKMCLALEFMGKHSNIILYNVQNNVIIGSIHNISEAKSSVREVYGGAKYIYPPIRQKLDVLNVSYSTFFEIAKTNDVKEISSNFYYLNQALLEFLFEKKMETQELFKTLQELQSLSKKELLCEFWGNEKNINSAIDVYFSNLMFEEILDSKKKKLNKILKNDFKKLQKILQNKPDEKKYEKNKNIADLLMINLYNISKIENKIVLDGYEIELDDKVSLNENAQRYYQKYKRDKATYEHTLERYNTAEERYRYFEGIFFDIENANSFDELSEIRNELIEIELINSKKENIKQELEPIVFEDFKIYIGKNNKQNDYLISKIASGEDLWFHGQGYPSSHVILKVPSDKKEIPPNVLEFCAKLTKKNSKAKNSGKALVIYTKRKNLKKPPNTYLGYVTYKNEVEIVV